MHSWQIGPQLPRVAASVVAGHALLHGAPQAFRHRRGRRCRTECCTGHRCQSRFRTRSTCRFRTPSRDGADADHQARPGSGRDDVVVKKAPLTCRATRVVLARVATGRSNGGPVWRRVAVQHSVGNACHAGAGNAWWRSVQQRVPGNNACRQTRATAGRSCKMALVAASATCATTPWPAEALRDFFSGLCAHRLACDPCPPAHCADPCANPCK